MFEEEAAAAVTYANILNDKVDVNLEGLSGFYPIEYTPLDDDDEPTFITLEVITLNS